MISEDARYSPHGFCTFPIFTYVGTIDTSGRIDAFGLIGKVATVEPRIEGFLADS